MERPSNPSGSHMLIKGERERERKGEKEGEKGRERKGGKEREKKRERERDREG